MGVLNKLRRLVASLAGREVHSREVRDALARASQQLVAHSLSSPAEMFRSLDSGEQGISRGQATWFVKSLNQWL